AVSSQWSWRVDHLIQLHDDGTVGFPASPQTLLTGRTPFAGSWMVGPGSTVRFDAVIVPVPEETRMVSVEVVEEPNGEGPNPGPVLEFLQSVRTWLLHRWNPPITESIPGSGYLPGNRRSGIVLLSGVGGRIQRSQVIHMPLDAGFSDSIQELLGSLAGRCFSLCEEKTSGKQPTRRPLELRVQFELVKDMRYVGLNRRL
ncbi:MAG: hypothetical protein O6840_06180, partial [Nitrospirae bacterium]|nr:hypothetical protein [Nitrospirota bacterium]